MTPYSSSILPTNTLSQLKETILISVLNGQKFPNSEFDLRFPDLPFVLKQENIYLIDKDITNIIHIDKLGKSIQLIPEDFLKTQTGKILFFSFQIKKIPKDLFLISLESNVFSSSNTRVTVLSSLRIKFRKQEKKWLIAEEPVFLSA